MERKAMERKAAIRNSLLQVADEYERVVKENTALLHELKRLKDLMQRTPGNSIAWAGQPIKPPLAPVKVHESSPLPMEEALACQVMEERSNLLSPDAAQGTPTLHKATRKPQVSASALDPESLFVEVSDASLPPENMKFRQVLDHVPEDLPSIAAQDVMIGNQHNQCSDTIVNLDNAPLKQVAAEFDRKLAASNGSPTVQDMPAQQESLREVLPDPNSPQSGESRLSMVRSLSASEHYTLEQQLERAIHGKEIEYDYWESIVFNKWFEIFFSVLILLNTSLMALEMQYIGEIAGADHGFKDESTPPDWIEDFLNVIHKVFLLFFTVELIAKILCLRIRFWKDSWNLLDLLIVLLGLFDLIWKASVGLDPMMIRMLRIVKLVRFVKVFKMSDNVFVLNLILKSIQTTLPTLVWSLVMLLAVQAVAGLFIGQVVYGYITDVDNDLEGRKAVYKYYGSFTKVMFTMWEVTTVNYSRSARVLTDNVDERWMWFFVVYRALVNIGLLQVIRAVFVQQTMKVAENDRELLLLSRERQRMNIIKKLTDVFNILDLDGKGELSEAEFQGIYNIPRMQAWLAALDIDPRFPDTLFQLLDIRGSGQVQLQDFLATAEKLRGPSHSVDLLHLASVVHRMEEKMNLSLSNEDVQCREILV